MTLAYNTQQITHQVLCLTHWESTTLAYLAIYGCCSQQFSCHGIAMQVLVTIMGSKLHGQLCCVYLVSAFDITRDKMNLAHPLLGRESLHGNQANLHCRWVNTHLPVLAPTTYHFCYILMSLNGCSRYMVSCRYFRCL